MEQDRCYCMCAWVCLPVCASMCACMCGYLSLFICVGKSLCVTAKKWPGEMYYYTNTHRPSYRRHGATWHVAFLALLCNVIYLTIDTPKRPTLPSTFLLAPNPPHFTPTSNFHTNPISISSIMLSISFCCFN